MCRALGLSTVARSHLGRGALNMMAAILAPHDRASAICLHAAWAWDFRKQRPIRAVNASPEPFLPQGFGKGCAMVSPAYEHHRPRFRVCIEQGAWPRRSHVWGIVSELLPREHRGTPSPFGSLFQMHAAPSRLRPADPMPAAHSGLVRKKVGDLQSSSDKLRYADCVVPIYQNPFLVHFLPMVSASRLMAASVTNFWKAFILARVQRPMAASSPSHSRPASCDKCQ